MIYRVIGVMSGNSSEILQMVFTELTETGGKWDYEIVINEEYVHDQYWKEQLKNAPEISALEYQLLHISYGKYIGGKVSNFIREHALEHRVHLIASDGYTVFHLPERAVAAQIGHGACIAAETKLPVVSDLLSLDLAFGGKGGAVNDIAQKLFPDEKGPYPGALVIALMGILRWREEANMFSSSTGASQDSIGGALWLGTEA